VSRLRGLTLLVAVVAALAVPAPAAAQDTRPRFVVAVLGDSYASGEGAPDVRGRHSSGGDLFGLDCINPACFSETWWSPDSWFDDRDAVFPQGDDPGWQADARRCHRSTKATGPHAGMLIADRFPDVRVEVLNFACGGAEIGRGLLRGWPGPEPPEGAANLPSQLGALEAYARDTDRPIDAIVMNIGGNDAKFDDLVRECIVLQALNPDCSNDQLLVDASSVLVDGPLGAPAPFALSKLNVRYAVLAAALQNRELALDVAVPAGTLPRLSRGRPDEVYLTGVPDAVHDAPPVDDPATNPTDFCDGTQSSDSFYRNLTLPESQALDVFLRGLHAAMQRASTSRGWIFMDQTFAAWTNHGICADGASFFRRNVDALRIQGDEGLENPIGAFVPISPGIAHPNDAGYADRARIVADVVEEHVRMLFRPPALNLVSIQREEGFTIGWTDPSPAHEDETRWELELAPTDGSPPVTLRSDNFLRDIDRRESGGSVAFHWVVRREGDFTARLRPCRSTRTNEPGYCGAFSNAVAVATSLPGMPTDLRRGALVGRPPRRGSNRIRLLWFPGPNTPASVRYEVHFGRFGAGGCPGRQLQDCTLLGQSGVRTTTATAATIDLPEAGEWMFSVRACSSAGCSPLSQGLIATVPGSPAGGPVGTFGMRGPAGVRAGRATLVTLAWRTPRRWTDLRRLDLQVRAGRRRLGTIRFAQETGALSLRRGRRRPFGHPDTQGRLKVGALALDLRRSALVRFGPRAQHVELRLALVPSRALRGRVLTLTAGGRDDRGRMQRQRLAGRLRVR